MLQDLVGKPQSAFHEIFEWSKSKSRPEWQRDALRRVIVNESISAKDLEDLERLCRSVHKIDSTTDPLPACVPLDASHLPPAPGAESAVSLVAIKAMLHVNRLPKGSGIPFGPSPGLSIVFGENGTGKSGFVRILKKSCRARGAAPVIKHNVFEPPASEKPSATIVARVKGSDQDVPWIDGSASDQVLSNIFVFDAASASHYLQEDESASFTPFGLDVLPTLSKICDKIASNLKAEIEQTKRDINAASSGWHIDQLTMAGKTLASLSSDTNIEDVRSISSLTDEQKKRILTLHGSLDSDPIQKARETRAAATRLKVYVEKLNELESQVGDIAIQNLGVAIAQVEQKRKLADAFKSKQFDSSFLAGTGAGLWRDMWEAAREFSTKSAYAGLDFPYTESDARCLLCQQDLGDNASERLLSFARYCEDQSQKQYEEALQTLAALEQEINEATPVRIEIEKVKADLTAVGTEIVAAVEAHAEAIDQRLATTQLTLAQMSEIRTSTLPTSVVPVLEALISQLETRAVTEESANDPKMREQLRRELAELDASDTLNRLLPEVDSQIGRLQKVRRLENCQKDTNTSSITVESTQLTKRYVSEAYCERFTQELKELELNSLGVKLVASQGKKGETKFGLRIVGAESEKIVTVASEGEQRCISLAAFLAELSQASHNSALIFDDPVSSLDHSYRRTVAARLVKESEMRQVIVFTHDVVFLSELQVKAADTNTAPDIKYLEWDNNLPGKWYEGLPWELKSVADRIDKLEKEQRDLKKSWNPIPNAVNKNQMRHAYDDLRATLERIVEKEILGDAIFRYRSYINVAKLDALIGFTVKEYDHLTRLMKRCHEVIAAHDPASGKVSVVPSPDEFANDIADVKALVDEVKSRRAVAKTT